jgi:hypothetical protein
MSKRTGPKHAIKVYYGNSYWVILAKCLGLFLAGAVIGLLFFYFFRNWSLSAIDRYKFLQNIFGVMHYEPGVRYISVLSAILIGNVISTIAYFILGYFKTLIPLSILSGFLMILILLTGAVKRQIAIPPEVIILFSVESFYRCLALTEGEHLFKNRLARKHVFVLSVVFIFILLFSTAFYEIYQIFGYIF